MSEHDHDRPDPSEDEEQDHTFRVEVDDSVLNEALEAVERSQGGGALPELKAKVAQLEEALKAKTDEAAQNRDKHLRAVADFDNFRKRALREREEARQYGAEALLRDLLGVLDNMERAIESAGDLDSIRQGVKMTHDLFKQILRQHGVEVVEAAGAPFDPTHHEAVAHIASDKHAAGIVIEEHRRGYTFRERLLRPAMVSVAKAIEAMEAAQSADTETEPED